MRHLPLQRTAYIGVELDRPCGDCDGELDGERFFQTKPNHGVFVREEQLDVRCCGIRAVDHGLTVFIGAYSASQRKMRPPVCFRACGADTEQFSR